MQPQPPWNPQPQNPPPYPAPAVPQYPVPGSPYPAAGQGPYPGSFMPPRRKSGWFKITVIIVGCVLLGLGGLIGLGALLTIPTEERAATAEERGRLMTADDISPYIEDFETDKARETVTYSKDLSGAVELAYEYEDEELYLNCTLTTESSSKDAKATYIGSKVGSALGMGLAEEDVKEEVHNELYKWDDESDFAILKGPQGSFGNRLVVRKDKKVIYIVFSGVYFDDSETLRELLDPVLARMTK